MLNYKVYTFLSEIVVLSLESMVKCKNNKFLSWKTGNNVLLS